MRRGIVYYNDLLAGTLAESEDGSYLFHYDDAYFQNTQLPAISVTLPKSKQQHRSDILFPFFFNLLSEGMNRSLQSRALKIDENDHFGMLLKTAAHETIGAITVREDD